MRFHSNGLLETPTINGAIDEYSVSIFASEHSELDARSQRRLTAIEITLNSGLPVQAAVASGGMVAVIEALSIPKEYKPPVKGWDDSYIIRTRDLDVMQAYLNEDRMSKLVNLMKVDKAWVIALFVSEFALLRLDTPLPIDNPKEMDVLIKQMINVARALELKDGEVKELLRKRSEDETGHKVLDIDDDLLDDHLGIELED